MILAIGTAVIRVERRLADRLQRRQRRQSREARALSGHYLPSSSSAQLKRTVQQTLVQLRKMVEELDRGAGAVDRVAPSGSGIELLSPMEKQVLRYGYVMVSGFLASWSLIFMKSFGEMNKGLAREAASPYADPRAYAMVLPVLLTLPCQLLYLNKALRQFEAQFVVPAMQARGSARGYSTTRHTHSGTHAAHVHAATTRPRRAHSPRSPQHADLEA